MLQDLEAGKPLELDALTGAIVELGRLTGVATPAHEPRLRAREAPRALGRRLGLRAAAEPFRGYGPFLSVCPGFPTTRSCGATSRTTTEPAPVSARSPIESGATSEEFEPMNASAPM